MVMVSVVMPVYNQETYLRAAIQSILAQTFTDFELVIVDDGSTDGTVEILRGLTDPRVRNVSTPHVGFLRALELSVREARGQWVARMDSDDVCHPERLERQLEFLHSHETCLFVGSVYGLITPNDRYLAPRDIFHWRYLQPRDITLSAVLFADPSVVFHRQQALDVGLYDPEFENEKPLWYKLLARGRGAVLGDPIYYVRWRVGSHSRNEHDAEKRRLAFYEIRRRYDLENARHIVHRSASEEPERSFLTYSIKGMNHYLLAGDHRAARGVAWRVWREYPLTGAALKLAAMAFLKRRTLRFWRPEKSHPTFAPISKPW